MASKIQVDVSLDPAVVRGVVEGLVQVNEVVLDPQVGDKCYTVTLCPGRPYTSSVSYDTYKEAEHVAGVVRRLAWLAVEEYLRAQAARVVEVCPPESWRLQPTVYKDRDPDPDTRTEFEKGWDALGVATGHRVEMGNAVWEYMARTSASHEVVVLGDQALPAECHPNTPRQGPLSSQPAGQANTVNHQEPAASESVQVGTSDMPDDKVVGPDLFAGDLSAMGRLLDDIAAATARHALRVQDLKQVARSAAEAIEQVVTDLKLKGRLSSNATELRQALARLEELEDR
jgi:hypothetical protein